MTDERNERAGPQAFLDAWMKTSREFVDSALKMWSVLEEDAEAAGEEGDSDKGRTRESWDAAIKSWQTLSAAISEPGAAEEMLKGINALPDVLLKVIQPAWNGVFHLQREFMERAGRIGQSTSPHSFENLDQDAFHAWSEIYEKEFRQFLKIPQLGLFRAYQERMNEAVDKFNVFEAQMAEFISVLYMPFEKSLRVMQEKVSEMVESGGLPPKGKDYYRLWVKVLEGRYMTLFKSPEYSKTLAHTMDAFTDFRAARHRMLQDALGSLPIPTYKEMDELYEELHHLKKRIKELEKNHRAVTKAENG
jgi:class III poly(R)-hydroxyalkanoic acid synthase PhaE subunit